jgi:ABC-type Na+ efflux pump permease subunit
MRKLWLIIKREYVTRVRTKGFVIATVGVPLFIAWRQLVQQRCLILRLLRQIDHH